MCNFYSVAKLIFCFFEFIRKKNGEAAILAGRTVEKEDNYGQKEFWEKRYNKEGNIKESKDKEHNENSDVNTPLYEWYLSFDEFSSLLLPELSQIGEFEDSKILVSGCGNSSLCEDLQNSGNVMIRISYFTPSSIFRICFFASISNF